MRNKRTLQYGLILGVFVPFLALSVVFADHEFGESEESHSTSQQVERPERSVQPQRANADQQKACGPETSSDICRGDGTRENKPEFEDKAARRRMMVAGLGNMMGIQINRAERAVARLDQIMTRIQSRYDKLADKEGVDLNKVDPLLAAAKKQKADLVTAITKAKTDWEAFKSAVGEKDNPRAAGQTFMASMKDVRVKLTSFHKSLMDLVRAMKSAEPKPEPNN
jgi:hypothetical protein